MGPNGSGKTTLLRALAGVSPDYSGEILWRGQQLPEASWAYSRDMIYVGHTPGIKKALTPLENLRWYMSISDNLEPHTIIDALEQVGLRGYEDTPCYQLSAGQLRRVALARLRLSRATLWILDEPFTAIDKTGIDQLEQLLQEHADRGGLVVLTSHQDLMLPQLKILNLCDFEPSADAQPTNAGVDYDA